MSKFIRYYISYIFESYFCWIHAQVSFLHFSSFVGCCKPIPLHYLVLPNYFDKLQNQINPESKSIYLSYFLLVRVFFGDFVYNISTFISIASKTLVSTFESGNSLQIDMRFDPFSSEHCWSLFLFSHKT